MTLRIIAILLAPITICIFLMFGVLWIFVLAVDLLEEILNDL